MAVGEVENVVGVPELAGLVELGEVDSAEVVSTRTTNSVGVGTQLHNVNLSVLAVPVFRMKLMQASTDPEPYLGQYFFQIPSGKQQAVTTYHC